MNIKLDQIYLEAYSYEINYITLIEANKIWSIDSCIERYFPGGYYSTSEAIRFYQYYSDIFAI
jgi:hypothetical protein